MSFLLCYVFQDWFCTARSPQCDLPHNCMHSRAFPRKKTSAKVGQSKYHFRKPSLSDYRYLQRHLIRQGLKVLCQYIADLRISLFPNNGAIFCKWKLNIYETYEWEIRRTILIFKECTEFRNALFSFTRERSLDFKRISIAWNNYWWVFNDVCFCDKNRSMWTWAHLVSGNKIWG